MKELIARQGTCELINRCLPVVTFKWRCQTHDDRSEYDAWQQHGRNQKPQIVVQKFYDTTTVFSLRNLREQCPARTTALYRKTTGQSDMRHTFIHYSRNFPRGFRR